MLLIRVSFASRGRRTVAAGAIGGALLGTLGLAGCPADPVGCRTGFVGDRAAPLRAEPVVVEVGGDGAARTVPIHDGDPVRLVIPPQGGFVVYAGALLANLDACGVTLEAQLDDAMTGRAITNRDSRRADLVPAGGGLYQPGGLASLSTVPNIPACPDALGAGVVGRAAVLSLTVRDRGGRTASAKRSVVPTCPDDAGRGFCLCTCGPDYRPGRCALDGGVLGGDGGAPGDGPASTDAPVAGDAGGGG